MACERFQPLIVERLYGEISADGERELARHLEGCQDCRDSLDALSRVREQLDTGDPGVALPRRVVVLKERRRLAPALLAASLAGAALLVGAAAGGGYAVGRMGSRAEPSVAAQPAEGAVALDAATRQAIESAVDEKIAATRRQTGSTAAARPAPVTVPQLDAALARLERNVRRDRAADMDFLMGQLAASEVRTGQRIGQTNQALRYVALASNPNVSEQ